MSPTARYLRLVGSWMGVAIGVPLLLRAELGVAPFDVLNTGVAHATGWSLGVCFVVNAIVFYLAGWLLGARLGWACIAGTIVIGPMVNVFLSIIPEQHALAGRLLLFVAGMAIIAVAICAVITTELGAGPSEVLMLGLVARGMRIVPARWFSDGLPLLIGAVIGGALGPGTLVFALCMGPMVKFGLGTLHYTAGTRHQP
ncbi:MAG: hypothetical protein KAY11_18685 [Ilumatobacteraceae bacterium]|nr:hypothetical protein [Ilumatobacteraceae bacterium]HAN35004.1 hypothetical protein [Acidimicrobiaceae bacterium]HQY13242.1 hypothetical protein [Ilumatobacteraceae bacterium]HQY83658.1 hypothetical protein [Ilumatobacteraceae bacterium]HRA86282.1 hypothetical protein [Ilumatobacteraceae bacterium]